MDRPTDSCSPDGDALIPPVQSPASVRSRYLPDRTPCWRACITAVVIAFAWLPLLVVSASRSVEAQEPERPDSATANTAPAPVVTAIAIHPHGTMIATGGDDHLIRLWDATDGRQLRVLRGHVDWVSAIVFSADGSRLVSAAHDGQMLDWDVQGASLRQVLRQRRFPFTSMYQIHGTDEVLAVGFKSPLQVVSLLDAKLSQALDCPCDDMRVVVASPDGSQFAAGGRNGRIRIWSREDGQVLHDVQAHDQRLRALTYSTDGQRLVSAGEDRAICIWDPRQGYEIRHIHRSKGKILSLVALDERRLAAGTSENVIDIWDMESGERIASLEGHTGSVSALARHGNRLISAGFDATMRWWDVTPSEVVAVRVIETTDGPIRR